MDYALHQVEWSSSYAIMDGVQNGGESNCIHVASDFGCMMDDILVGYRLAC